MKSWWREIGKILQQDVFFDIGRLVLLTAPEAILEPTKHRQQTRLKTKEVK